MVPGGDEPDEDEQQVIEEQVIEGQEMILVEQDEHFINQ